MDARTRQRAEEGDPDACARLGMALLGDVGTSGAVVAEAAGWLEKAVASSGGQHPEASFTLGCLAARCAEDAVASGGVGGEVVAGLLADAESRWTEAAERGHGRAACFLGKLLLENAGASGVGGQDHGMEEAGLRWLERAAGAGDALGMYNLGVALWGRGKIQDAVRRWEGAAELGDPEARLSLALAFSGGAEAMEQGIEVDEERALAYVRAAAEGVGAEAGGPRAMLLLANFLAAGTGCKASHEAAAVWRERALAAMSEEERCALGHQATAPSQIVPGRQARTAGKAAAGALGATSKQPAGASVKGKPEQRSKPTASSSRTTSRTRGSAARVYGGGKK